METFHHQSIPRLSPHYQLRSMPVTLIQWYSWSRKIIRIGAISNTTFSHHPWYHQSAQPPPFIVHPLPVPRLILPQLSKNIQSSFHPLRLIQTAFLLLRACIVITLRWSNLTIAIRHLSWVHLLARASLTSIICWMLKIRSKITKFYVGSFKTPPFNESTTSNPYHWKISLAVWRNAAILSLSFLLPCNMQSKKCRPHAVL